MDLSPMSHHISDKIQMQCVGRQTGPGQKKQHQQTYNPEHLHGFEDTKVQLFCHIQPGCIFCVPLGTNTKMTPLSQGYRFPAEWEPHEATWLTYPHHPDSFPGRMEEVLPVIDQFIRIISIGEQVRINVHSREQLGLLARKLEQEELDSSRVALFVHPSNDVWCRDHGPSFVIRSGPDPCKAIVNWRHNAWGGKYPWQLDDAIPSLVAQQFDLPVFEPGIIMEGGSVEFNGCGVLMTTRSCLLHPNRNPKLSQPQIEEYLRQYYGVSHILWLGEGIEGDDTDGHIDDITRFVDACTVVTAVEHNKKDVNYLPLQKNLQELQKMRLPGNRNLEIVELPMPKPVVYQGIRLPASYANFYITNRAVIVPTFRCSQDDVALDILSGCFPGRKIIGLDSVPVVWGLGSFHCLSQQEPAVPLPTT